MVLSFPYRFAMDDPLCKTIDIGVIEYDIDWQCMDCRWLNNGIGSRWWQFDCQYWQPIMESVRSVLQSVLGLRVTKGCSLDVTWNLKIRKKIKSFWKLCNLLWELRLVLDFGPPVRIIDHKMMYYTVKFHILNWSSQISSENSSSISMKNPFEHISDIL